MKIGIVTQPLTSNYGGILQNFALQQVLKNMGHTPVTLDYMHGKSGLHYVYPCLKHLAGFMLGRSNYPFIPYAPTRSNKTIVEFIDRHISKTKTFWNNYSKNLVKKYGCDAVISGSDQVWRPKYNRRQLYDMYLKFCKSYKIPKIAYAASFGTADWEYTDEKAAKCTGLLKHFNAVSVREESGLKHLERLGRRDGVHVLDPTLLLGRDGFDKTLSLEDAEFSKQKYLGAYILDINDEIEAALSNIKEEHGLKEIKSFSANAEGMGPEEWIKTIKYSSYFVTDSFHGTVFCILYHVPFVTLVNQARGADRFYSLLEPLDLADRMATTPEEISAVETQTIDWDDVDARLAELRQKSMDFLEKALRVTPCG